MDIPAYPVTMRREVFIRNIQRKPTPVQFRGNSTVARFEEPSYSRRMEAAGYMQETLDVECMIATEIGDPPPEPRKDTVMDISSGAKWRIIEVRRDPGEGCYLLSLNKVSG